MAAYNTAEKFRLFPFNHLNDRLRNERTSEKDKQIVHDEYGGND